MLQLSCIWYYVNDDMEEISEKLQVVYFKLYRKQRCEEADETTKTVKFLYFVDSASCNDSW